MTLSRLQFDCLVTLQEAKGPVTQRELARISGWSLGSVNRVMGDFAQRAWLEEGRISPLGLEVLEPYRVKRAIFLAAGFGSRMLPITLNTPKPLIRVQGVRIIDTLLDAVVGAGIEEIILVRGYLAEQFDQLLYKYPGIRFIDNPLYNETNNISSLLYARDYLPSSYVLEADLYLRNPGLIRPYQYVSHYLGVPVQRTDDWCLISQDKRITDFRLGGENCHHMFGISYWTPTDGKRLASRLEKAFDLPGGRERFWDTVALNTFSQDFRIEIRECSFQDLVELDTFRELRALDPAYDPA